VDSGEVICLCILQHIKHLSTLLITRVLFYRFLKKCKGYVRTKSHPEGSLFDESLTFCSQYLQDETHFDHRVRNHDRVQKEISPTTPFFDSIG
jgi:hypothetical protein